MMVLLREKLLKSRFYKVVLWVIAFSMGGGTILFSPFFLKQARSARPLVLKVNGEGITEREYELRLAKEYENLALLRQYYGQYADAYLKSINPQKLALQGLVNETLMDHAAAKLNFQFSTQFVSQKLQDPAFVVQELRDIVPIQAIDRKSGLIDMGALKYWLQRRGQTVGEFEKDLEGLAKRKIVRDLVAGAAFISPEEIKERFILVCLKKKYVILRLPFENYLKAAQKEPIDLEELTHFFESENNAHKRYWVSEKRSGMLWTFRPEDYGISISDKEVEEYYTKHKQEKFLESPVQIRLRRILFKVEKGVLAETAKEKAQKLKAEFAANPELFEKHAQTYSDDKETASKGGDLGFVKRGDHDPALWRAALRLQTDGAISEPVTTNDGVEIVQRVARKASSFKPLEKVKKEIQKTVLRQTFKRKFADEAECIIKENESAVKAFVKKKKGKKEAIAKQPLTTSLLSKKLFKTRKGSWGYLFDEDGNGILLTVSEIEKTHEPSLEQVKKDVERDFYEQRAEKALNNAVKKVKEQAKHEELAKIASNMGLRVKNTDWVRRAADHEGLKALEAEGIPARQLFFQSNRVGSIIAASGEKNYYIAQLENVEPFNETLYKDKKQEIKKDLLETNRAMLTRAFVDSLYKNARMERIEEPRASQHIPLDDIF